MLPGLPLLTRGIGEHQVVVSTGDVNLGSGPKLTGWDRSGPATLRDHVLSTRVLEATQEHGRPGRGEHTRADGESELSDTGVAYSSYFHGPTQSAVERKPSMSNVSRRAMDQIEAEENYQLIKFLRGLRFTLFVAAGLSVGSGFVMGVLIFLALFVGVCLILGKMAKPDAEPVDGRR